MDVFNLSARITLNLDDFESNLAKAQKKFKAFGDNISGLSSNIDKVYSGVKDVLQPAVDGFKAVEGVGKKAGNVISGGLKVFATAATAVGGFGASAVNAGMQFDAAMSQVSAVSGATGSDFEKLRDKALEMGAKTQFSASEAAEAMNYMAMAGWKTEDMLGGIAGIMNLAAASGEDLATTSDIVTDALTAFGLTAGDSGHFADVMAVAASNANTNVGMMGQTFKYVAPVAGSLGYSIDDTAMAIGLMANSGIKATQAGTALRSIMTRLATNAGETKSSMGALSVLTQELGVEFYNTDGSARDLNSVLMEAREAWRGLSDEQAIAYAKTIAGQEAMSGWLAIMNAAPEDINKLTSSLREADGAAEKMAATMMDNLAGDMKLFKSAVESLQIAISDSLTPTLREFAQFGQKAMQKLLEGFQGSGVSGFMSALSDVVTQGVKFLSEKAVLFASVSLQFIEALANGVLNARYEIAHAVINIFDMLIDGIGSWLSTNSGDLIDAGNKIIAILFSAFLKAENLISENIGQFIPLIARAFIDYHDALFMVGIDILGAIGKGIVDNKEGIQNMASQAIGEMVWHLKENAPMIIEGGLALLEALVGAVEENLPLIVATGTEIVGRLVAGISTASPAVQAIIATAVLPHILKIIDVVGNIGGAVKNMIGIVQPLISGIVKLVSSGITTILSIGSKLMTGIKALFALIMAHPVVAVVTAIIAAIVLLWNHCEAFRNAVKAIWDAIVGVFKAAAEGIKAAFEGTVEFFAAIWQGIQNIFSAVADVLGGFFRAAWDAIQSAWSAVVEFFAGIWQGIQEVFSAVGEFFGNVFRAALEAIKTAWAGVTEFFSSIWEGIKNVFSTVKETLGGFFSDAWAAIKEVWSTVKDFFVGIGEGIREVFSEVTEFLGNVFKSAWEAVKGAWEAAKEFFSGVWDSIKTKGEAAASAVGDALKNAWNTAKTAWDNAASFFSGIMDKIKSVFTNLVNSAKTWGKDMLSNFVSGISEKVGAVVSKVKSVAQTVRNYIGFSEPKMGPLSNFHTYAPDMMQLFADGIAKSAGIVQRQLDKSLNFDFETRPLTFASNGASARNGQSSAQTPPAGAGNTTVIINSPLAVDAIQAAREWKKTTQRMAMGYV